MQIIENTNDFYLEKETAVAIGKFDGVHKGHRRLLEEITARKKEGLLACVFTFHPAPAAFLGYSDGKELTTREEKRLLFERLGIDILVEFPLTSTTIAMEPEVFARQVLNKQLNARFIAAGDDLSFGAGGRGNAELLRSLSGELNFELKTIGKVCVEDTVVSSTFARQLLEQGDMKRLECFLDMPYMIAGEVVHGNRLGRTIGFPTVNLLPGEKKLLPPFGVYYSEVKYKGRMYSAISNVGYKPTVTEERICGVETYLYDFNEQIYGESIEVYLLEFKRGEQRFAGVDALKKQLQEDIAEGKLYNGTRDAR